MDDNIVLGSRTLRRGDTGSDVSEPEPVLLAAASIPVPPAPDAASSPKARTSDAPPLAAKAVRIHQTGQSQTQGQRPQASLTR